MEIEVGIFRVGRRRGEGRIWGREGGRGEEIVLWEIAF